MVALVGAPRSQLASPQFMEVVPVQWSCASARNWYARVKKIRAEMHDSFFIIYRIDSELVADDSKPSDPPANLETGRAFLPARRHRWRNDYSPESSKVTSMCLRRVRPLS